MRHAAILLVGLLAIGCAEQEPQTLEASREEVQQAEAQVQEAREKVEETRAQARERVGAAEEELAEAEQEAREAQQQLEQRMLQLRQQLEQLEAQAATDGITPEEQRRLDELRQREQEIEVLRGEGRGSEADRAARELEGEVDRVEQDLDR